MAELKEAEIRHALNVARNRGFQSVEIENDGSSFWGILTPGNSKAEQPNQAVVNTTIPTKDEPAALEITSPGVGFYREASEPLRAGRRLNQGDVVGAIAALGLNNDITSTVTGEVIEVLINADDPIQYGQVIARLKP